MLVLIFVLLSSGSCGLLPGSVSRTSRSIYARRGPYHYTKVIIRWCQLPSEHTDSLHSFVKRDQEELDQLKAERRPGRPASSRQDLLSQLIETEQQEYASGFWVPDMLDEANVKALREWSGVWGAMNQLKYCRVAQDGTVKASDFPPHKAA